MVLYDPYERQTCVPMRFEAVEGAPKGYEFVDLGRGQVWGTADWSETAFNAFKLPWHKPLYFKNDPRVGYADHARILRSPDCERDGAFNTLTAFGKEFRHVVQVSSVDHIGRGDSRISLTEIVKYHALTYSAGREVSVLHAPDGAQYIAVAGTSKREPGIADVPDGWRIETYHLEQDFELNLFGEVTNIRTTNKDSFQGPLAVDQQFPLTLEDQ